MTTKDHNMRRCAQARARRSVSGSFVSFSELPAESVGSVGGASPPEQKYQRQTHLKRLDSSQTRNNEQAGKQEICLHKNILTCSLFRTCRNFFSLSASALKSFSVFAVIRLVMGKCIQKCAAGI